jgi:hypothetical protein
MSSEVGKASKGRRRDRLAAAVLLAAAAIAATTVGAQATAVTSSASSSWQVSVRRQLDQAERIRDGVDQVYATEAPQAVRVAEARLQADELSSAAASLGEPDRSTVLAQASAQAAVANALAATASPLATDARYLTPAGFDLGRRLADVRGTQVGASARDPIGTAQDNGDEEAREGLLLVAATIPIAVAFLLGALAQAYAAAARRLVVVGGIFLVLALGWAVAIQATY